MRISFEARVLGQLAGVACGVAAFALAGCGAATPDGSRPPGAAVGPDAGGISPRLDPGLLPAGPSDPGMDPPHAGPPHAQGAPPLVRDMDALPHLGLHPPAVTQAAPTLATPTALTIEAWINRPAAPARGQPVDLAPTVAARLDGMAGWRLWVDNHACPRFDLVIDHVAGSWPNQISCQNSVAVAVGWSHLAATFDGFTVAVYSDGILRTRETVPAGSLTESHGQLTIGGEPDPTEFGRHPGMPIAEVQLWRVVRTADQIASDAITPPTGSEPGLVGYWPLHEGQGTALGDLSQNANDARLAGPADGVWVAGAAHRR